MSESPLTTDRERIVDALRKASRPGMFAHLTQVADVALSPLWIEAFADVVLPLVAQAEKERDGARAARDQAVALADEMRERAAAIGRVRRLRGGWQAEIEDEGDGQTYLGTVLAELDAALGDPANRSAQATNPPPDNRDPAGCASEESDRG